MEIIIGREPSTSQLKLIVDGKDQLFGQAGSVPPTVSMQHCKLTITSRGMRLYNLDINNHTYVNGREIEAKAVSHTDQIMLGTTHFLLPWAVIAKMAPADIRPLEQVWNAYEHERMELQIAERRFNTLRSATGLITMIAIALGFLTGRQNVWLILLYAAAILISLVFTVKAWRNASLIPQKTQKLSQQFQHDYVCPSCGRFLGNQSYPLVAQNDHCPYCRKQFIH